MTCPSCGAANHADFSFCLQCGPPLSQPGGGGQPARAVDPGGETRADMEPLRPMDAGTVAMSVPTFESPASVSMASQRTSAQLRVEQGSVDEQVISLDRPITIIGRRQGSDIVIHDTNVSRMHAQIRRDGSRLTIEDAGSSNGTTVNDERIEQSVDLKGGDVIRIGDAVFVVEMSAPATLMEPEVAPEGSTMAIDLDSPMTSLGGAPELAPPPGLSPVPAPVPVYESEPVSPPPAPPPAPVAAAPSSPLTPPPAIMDAYDDAYDDYAGADGPNHTVLSESLLYEEDLSSPNLPATAEPAPPVNEPRPAVHAPAASARAESGVAGGLASGSTSDTLAALRRELTEVGHDLTNFSGTLGGLADRVERLEKSLDAATSELASVADAIRGPDAAVLSELQGILADIERADDGPKLEDALQVLEQLAAHPRDIELLLKLSQQAGAIESALRVHGRLVAAAPSLQATLARLTG